ncbi:MAG: alpha/beta fold hydrolase [Deltaproteobacteria bacterium]|nr:alpha/beta fold hydrolase [Deltaproteobacteria bacterium]MBI4224091.1 alpha/beta fold hydrolase [Deltaproteobacteria bacterium]
MAKKGCLVVHGLTGTPANMESVAVALRQKGFLVKVPLLAGHGEKLENLSRTGWRDWYATVVEAFEELAGEADQIYYAGLSMGALLGLKLAIDKGAAIKALALLAVPFRVRPLFRRFVIPGVRYTPLRFVIRSVAKNFEKSVLDPEGRKKYRAASIARMPSRGVFETQNLMWVVEKELSKIKQPLLLIHGQKDHLADPEGLFEIKVKVSSSLVDIVMFKNSAHVLTVDREKDDVARRVVGFFETA